MNNIDTSQIVDPNVEQPFLGGSLAFLQNATKESIANVVIGMIGKNYSTSTVYILYGCVRSGTADGGTGNTSITAGAVFYNGEVFTVQAQTVALVANNLYGAIGITPISPDPVTFSDGSSHNVHLQRQFTMSTTNTGKLFNNWVNMFDVTTITNPTVSGTGGTFTASGNLDYYIVGQTITVSFYLYGGNVSSGNTQLNINLPTGINVPSSCRFLFGFYNGSADKTSLAIALNNTISLFPIMSGSSTFTAYNGYVIFGQFSCAIDN